jgi:hypothetical protein
MNIGDLMQYLTEHKGVVRVGNPDTLKSALQLVKEGIVEKYGIIEGQPLFRLTQKGVGMIVKPKSAKAKEAAVKILHAVQSYSDSFKEEHPAGLSELGRLGGMSFAGGTPDEWDATRQIPAGVSSKPQRKKSSRK